jgi:putative mycofactocin binding protein MftB
VRGVLIHAAEEAGGSPRPVFAPSGRYRLDPDVALRPEPFGALAYHYGSRRLTFLRSPLLVDLVRDLAEHPTVDDAVTALVPAPRRAGFLRALASLAESSFIVPIPPPPAPPTGDGGPAREGIHA